MHNLREVGVPSWNILHVRGRGSKSRIRVAGRVRVVDAQKVSKKDRRCGTTANFDLLRDPLFLPPGMRTTSSISKIESLSNLHQIDSICKGVLLRPILTSPGTLFSWHRACMYFAIALKIE